MPYLVLFLSLLTFQNMLTAQTELFILENGQRSLSVGTKQKLAAEFFMESDYIHIKQAKDTGKYEFTFLLIPSNGRADVFIVRDSFSTKRFKPWVHKDCKLMVAGGPKGKAKNVHLAPRFQAIIEIQGTQK